MKQILLKSHKNKNGKGSYSFSYDNYKAGKCGSGHTLAYDSYDITPGDPTYDAARANMEEPWMMFTKDQAQELLDNTTYEYTKINGVNSGKFTSNTDSSKYIIIPAAGYWLDHYSDANQQARCWSATIYTSGAPYRISTNAGGTSIGFEYSNYGLSVRAVRKLKR